MNLKKLINENNEYEFELQKLLDISSNINDENLRIRIIAQFIKCQEKILKILNTKN